MGVQPPGLYMIGASLALVLLCFEESHPLLAKCFQVVAGVQGNVFCQYVQRKHMNVVQSPQQNCRVLAEVIYNVHSIMLRYTYRLLREL